MPAKDERSSADKRPLSARLPGGTAGARGLWDHLPALAAFAVGVGLSIAAYSVVEARDQRRQLRAFERRADLIAVALRGAFRVSVGALHAAPSLFEASEEVSRDAFRAFAHDALARHPEIYAFAWIPGVPAAERARFVEPPNATALAFDLAAEPTRRAPADRAAATGQLVASPRLERVEGPVTGASVALYIPVYQRGAPRATPDERSAGVRGWAAGVLRVGSAVEQTLAGLDLAGLDLLLLDESGSPDGQVLFATPPAPGGAAAAEGAPRVRRGLPFADRRWTLVLTAHPGDHDGRGAAILAGGIALSALGAAYLSASGSVRRLRRQIAAARRLGQYTLEEKLGEGGMGAVYNAEHAMLRRPTAVKLLRPGDATHQRLARFEREVQLTSRLTHPNTIAIFDYGRTPEGVFYYAMEYLDGLTLEELVRLDGPQPPGRVIHLLEQVCGALAEAHAVGLIHRDIKPANLMLCQRGGIPDFVKVLDFGLVKELSRESLPPLSVAGTFIGTPHYLAPEAIRTPDKVDARSDLYAAGAVGYFLLTGAPVFQGRTLLEICGQHLHAEPAPPSRCAPYPMPPALEGLILRCLAKDPAARPASALEVLDALQATLVLDPWRRADAERWWRERGGSLKSAAQGARAGSRKADKEPLLRTVAIDMHRRKPRDETA